MSHTRKPKAVAPLPTDAVEALRARVDASNISHAARELAVSGGLVTRALRGEGVTPSIHRLLTLQLAPPARASTRHAAADPHRGASAA